LTSSFCVRLLSHFGIPPKDKPGRSQKIFVVYIFKGLWHSFLEESADSTTNSTSKTAEATSANSTSKSASSNAATASTVSPSVFVHWRCVMFTFMEAVFMFVALPESFVVAMLLRLLECVGVMLVVDWLMNVLFVEVMLVNVVFLQVQIVEMHIVQMMLVKGVIVMVVLMDHLFVLIMLVDDLLGLV